MKLRIYLDTSVFSAYFDERAPERRELTQQFWNRLPEFDVGTSEVAWEELSRTTDLGRRAELLGLLSGVAVHSLTEEIRALGRRYIDAHVFAPTSVNDALHVAVAVLTRHDILASWNFRHLVNRQRRARINEVNVLANVPTIEILAPPEI
ncbi:MAG: PIN domain-containing protein [Planctomycetota bacterium]